MTTAHRTLKDCQTLSLTGDVYSMLVTGEDTVGAYAVVHALIPPGGGPPPHTHTREEETFFIVEGEVTIALAGRSFVARPGDVVRTPMNVLHTFANKSSRPAKMLITIVPAGLERMFAEIGDPLAPGATTPSPVTDAAIAKVIEACPRYGVVLGGP